MMSKKNNPSNTNDGFDDLEAQFFQQGVEQEKQNKEAVRYLRDEFADEDFATADVTIDDLDDVFMPVDSSELAEGEELQDVIQKSRVSEPSKEEQDSAVSELNNIPEVEILSEAPSSSSDFIPNLPDAEESVLGDSLDAEQIEAEAFSQVESIGSANESEDFIGDAIGEQPSAESEAITKNAHDSASLDLYVPAAPVRAARDLVQCLLLEAEQLSENEGRGAFYSEAALISNRILRDHEAAYKAYYQADNVSLLEPDSLREFADVCAKRGELFLSAELLERWARSLTPPQVISALIDVGLFEMSQLNRTDRAISLLQQALDVQDSNWNVLHTLSHLLENDEDWEQASRIFEKMGDLSKGGIAAHYYFEAGFIHEEQTLRPNEALRLFRQAFEANPNDTEVYVAYERLLRQTGHDKERISLYLTKASLMPNSSQVWEKKAAYLAIESGDLTKALEICRGQESYLAYLLHQKSGSADYLTILESMLSNTTGNRQAYVSWCLGEGHLKDGNVTAALAAYRTGFKLNPQLFPFAEKISELMLIESDYDAIASYVEQQIEMAGNNSNLALMWEGYLLKAAVKHSCENDFLKRSKHPVFHQLNGLLLLKESRWEEAFELFWGIGEATESASHYVLAADLAENKLNLPSKASLCFQAAKRANQLHPVDLANVVQLHQCRLAAQSGDWSMIIEQLSESQPSPEDNILLGLIHWVFMDDIEAAAGIFLSLLQGEQKETVLSLLVAMLPNTDIRLIEALERLSGHFGAESILWNDLLISRPGGRWKGTLPNDLADWVMEEQLLNSVSPDQRIHTLKQGLAGQSEYVQAQSLFGLLHLAVEHNQFSLVELVFNHLIQSSTHPSFLLAITQTLESVEAYDEALALFEHFSDGTHLSEIARLSESESHWIAAHKAQPDNMFLAFQTLQFVLSSNPSHPILAQLYLTLAQHLGDDNAAIRQYFALAAGYSLKSVGNNPEAAKCFHQIFDASPGLGKAFDGLVDIYVAEHQLSELEALFEALPNPEPIKYAESLERMREFELAGLQYQAQFEKAEASKDAFGLSLLGFRITRCSEYAGLWAQAATHLRLLLENWKEPTGRRYLNSKLHWILVEHLADSELALETFTYLHQENPNDLEILEALARITGEHGETEVAVQYLQQLATNAQSPEVAAKYYRHIANAYYTVEKIDQAKTALLDALDLNPNDMQAINTLKSIYASTENYDDLIALLTREANLYDTEQKLVCLQQIANIRQTIQHNYPLAIDAWSKVLDLSPNNVNALSQLVEITDLQDDAESMASYSEALLPLLQGEERVGLQHRLGILYYSDLMQEEAACAMLEESVQHTAHQSEAASILVDIYSQRGDWLKLVQLYQQLSERQSETLVAAEYIQKAIAVANENIGDRELIFKLYQRYATYDPSNMDSVVFCAMYEYDLENFSAAIPYFEDAKAYQKEQDLDDFDVRLNVANYFYSFGVALMAEGSVDRAIVEFEEVLELNRGHLPTLQKIGPLLFDNNETDRAEDVFRRILELTAGQSNNPMVTQAYIYLGRVELRRDRLDKAKKRLSDALKNDPNSIEALQVMAEIMFRLGEWNALFKAYNTIISSCGDTAVVTEAYYMKAFVLDKKMGKTDKSIQHHLKSLEIKEQQPRVFRRLAEIYLRQDKFSDAVQAAGRGIACSVDNEILSSLYLLRTSAEQNMGNDEFAAELYGHALEQNEKLSTALGTSIPEAKRLKAYLHDLLEEAI